MLEFSIVAPMNQIMVQSVREELLAWSALMFCENK